MTLSPVLDVSVSILWCSELQAFVLSCHRRWKLDVDNCTLSRNLSSDSTLSHCANAYEMLTFVLLALECGRVVRD